MSNITNETPAADVQPRETEAKRTVKVLSADSDQRQEAMVNCSSGSNIWLRRTRALQPLVETACRPTRWLDC